MAHALAGRSREPTSWIGRGPTSAVPRARAPTARKDPHANSSQSSKERLSLSLSLSLRGTCVCVCVFQFDKSALVCGSPDKSPFLRLKKKPRGFLARRRASYRAGERAQTGHETDRERAPTTSAPLGAGRRARRAGGTAPRALQLTDDRENGASALESSQEAPFLSSSSPLLLSPPPLPPPKGNIRISEKRERESARADL